MKRFFLGIVLTCLLVSCKAPQIAIGMSEQDFVKRIHALLVESSSQRTVYKKIFYPFGAPDYVRFYYFSNGTLFRIDGGTQRPDVIIKQE